jgi:PAS domain S-box-containing protein
MAENFETKTAEYNQDHYRLLAENMVDVIWTMNSKGEFTYVSPSVQRLRGYSPEEVLAQTPAEALTPASRLVMEAALEKVIPEVIKGKAHYPLEPMYNELEQPCKDGSTVWTEALVKVLFDEHGVFSGFLGVSRDITDRKQTELLLKESEARYQEMADLLPQIIFETDLSGKLTYINRQAYTIFGYKTDEKIIGRSTLDFHLPEDRQRAIDNITRKIAGKSAGSNEYTMVRKDGSRFPVLIYSEPKMKYNLPVGLRGIIVDITDRKRAETEIRTLNETLEQRVAHRTRQVEKSNKELAFHLKETEQFTYIATHDLQEPLNTLTNFTKLIHAEYAGKLDDDGNKYIDFIHDSAARMSNLVKDLLEYSLLGKESEITTIDCNKIVADVLADMDDSIKTCQARIAVKELPCVQGFATELRLLFQNLVNNAIKFRKKGVNPAINISAERLEKEWLFSIEDNGIGIDDKDKEKIFVIFKRMQNRKDYDGTGIGLAHCKKIVELHGGKIWVESMKDRGSIFRFTIPCTA